MKQLFIFSFLSLSFLTAQAQQLTTLSGVVYSEGNKVLNYASVALLSVDSLFVKGVFTNLDGSYKLQVEEGEYIIRVQAPEYADISEIIKLAATPLKKDFTLKVNVVALSDVVVVGKKPMIKREADKIVFVANDVAAGSNNAFDILKNVPGVVVTNDEIKILGQQGVKVLINDKDTKMGSSDLVALLKSYQAEQIDNIEVILTPSSKFDAEGSAGILNIKLKKAKNDYAAITLNYAMSYDKYSTNELNANVIYNKKHVNASLSLGGIFGKTHYEETNHEQHDTYGRDNVSQSLSKNDSYNLRGNVDYQVTDNFMIGALATYNKNKNTINLDGESTFHSGISSKMDSILLSISPNFVNRDNYRANIYSDIKLDSLGKNIHIDVDYLYSQYDSKKQFDSKTFNSDRQHIGGDYGFNNDNNRNVNYIGASIDFALPYKTHKLKFGAKISLSKSRNSLKYYKQTNLEDQNDDFVFDENIYAIYGDYSTNFTDQLSFKSGLRIEHTLTKGESLIDKNRNPPNNGYTGFFPTVFLGYKLNDDNQFNLSLSSRISRPNFRNINPFVLYLNKYSTVSGKSDLKPSYTYKVNLGYTLKNNFSVDLFYIYETNIFTQVQRVDGSDLMVNTFWDNVLDKHTVGINNSYFYNNISWLQLFVIHGIYYEQSYSDSRYTLPQRNGFSYIAMINSNFFFNKQKTFTGWLNASYNSPQKLATTDVQSTYNIGLGFQYSILNNSLKIALSVTNLLSSNVRGNVNSPDFQLYFNNEYSYPTAKIALTYTIGAKLRGKRFTNSEIQDRL